MSHDERLGYMAVFQHCPPKLRHLVQCTSGRMWPRIIMEQNHSRGQNAASCPYSCNHCSCRTSSMNTPEDNRPDRLAGAHKRFRVAPTPSATEK
ncbi:hypothetical protein AVEN_71452-1 [Araneus ventricosus]|uniref:Uncharacterized protein n=1 Tax=Araneus ventricosus TaxID=182803 RepID=A0A4Y2CU57_ARAVE|nr:hypothetical protein AVEN_71452-1 [Araneus ventricosus]